MCVSCPCLTARRPTAGSRPPGWSHATPVQPAAQVHVPFVLQVPLTQMGLHAVGAEATCGARRGKEGMWRSKITMRQHCSSLPVAHRSACSSINATTYGLTTALSHVRPAHADARDQSTHGTARATHARQPRDSMASWAPPAAAHVAGRTRHQPRAPRMCTCHSRCSRRWRMGGRRSGLALHAGQRVADTWFQAASLLAVPVLVRGVSCCSLRA